MSMWILRWLYGSCFAVQGSQIRLTLTKNTSKPVLWCRSLGLSEHSEAYTCIFLIKSLDQRRQSHWVWDILESGGQNHPPLTIFNTYGIKEKEWIQMMTQFHAKKIQKKKKNIHINFSIHYSLVHPSAIHPYIQYSGQQSLQICNDD